MGVGVYAAVARGFAAGVYDVTRFYKRRPLALVAAFSWPLLYLAFLFLAIYFTGRAAAYAESLHVNPSALTRFLPAAGFLVMAAGSIVDGTMMTVQGLRWNGVLPYFLATPGALLRLLTGYALGATTVMLAVTLAPFVPMAAVLAGPSGVIVVLVTFLLSALAAFALIGLGALSAALALLANRERMPTMWLLPLVILLSAIFYPVTLLPPFLRVAAEAIPLYHVSHALREIASFLEARRLLAVLGVLMMLGLGYSTLYAPAALLAERARRRSIE